MEGKEQISEEPFEIPGSSTNPDSLAPLKGRTNVEQQVTFMIFFLFIFQYVNKCNYRFQVQDTVHQIY